jgi:uncharacterized protein (TIGR03000 family)
MYAIVLATMMSAGAQTPCEFHSCYGCCGCWGCFGCHGVYVFPQKCPSPYVPEDNCHPGHPAQPLPAPSVGSAAKPAGATAVLKVQVAADARLYINGQLMRTTSAERSFDTPVLERGKTYHYTLRAEAVRDGKTLSETKKVAVRAGEETRASLLRPAGRAVASSRR